MEMSLRPQTCWSVAVEILPLLADNATAFALLGRLMSIALSCLMLMVIGPRIMRWSLPLLKLLITDTSVNVCGLSVRV